MINVKNISNNTYKVTLDQGGSHTYNVTVKPDYYQKLTGGSVSPEQLIEKSFEFLLERESPSMILSTFDLPVIQSYFSEYEGVIKKRLDYGSH